MTIAQARRMALAAQGLDVARPARSPDGRQFGRILRLLGAVQLDSVNVVARAHYLPFFTRLGPYDRARLDAYLRTPRVLEYWGHAASVMPVELYPWMRHRMRAMAPWGSVKRLVTEQPAYIERVYRHVSRNGPLQVSDLPDGGPRTGPWWGYGEGKIALEWLFARGRVGAVRTPSFGRNYDIPARLYPSDVLARPTVPREQAYEDLIVAASSHLGVASADDLADYYRLRLPRARPLIERLAERGRLTSVEVAGQMLYAHPRARSPRQVQGCRLVSPFDSLVWYRPRLERLFGFSYRIEIYVPRGKRRYGYYVLPVLLDGRFVARVDLKTHRDRGTLEVRGAYLEPDVPERHTAVELAQELRSFATWLELDSVTVAGRGNLAGALRRAVDS